MEFKEDSQAVQSHLGILQNVIQRMASNSSSAKAWCVTLVSAILVIIADKGKSEYALIAVMPTLLFLFLDAYYLGLEQGFRNSYNDFISKLHKDEIDSSDLFEIKPEGNQILLVLKSIISFSVWPFYSMLLVMIYVAKTLIL
tara:strand:+ start:19433 stop:19858 length:426 start_codon:yes stop_codon:yes gene_type:complete